MPRTILVIDDEEDMRELSTFALELDGQTAVVTASSGADGLRLAREVQPTAILLDWMMPGMDGEATLAALKSDPLTTGIPVIVLSGAVHHRSIDWFQRLGAHDVVAKPYNPVTLGEEVRALLSGGPR
jgi:CheY-like chemotaxis protein